MIKNLSTTLIAVFAIFCLSSQTVFWEDNFDDPTNWAIDNNGSGPDNDFGWSIKDFSSSWFFGPNIIQSNSGGNFAELNNGNPNLGEQLLDVTFNLTLDVPIDLVALGAGTDVSLEFLQFGARFLDRQSFQISTDGGNTWIEVGNNNDIEMLTGGGGSAFDNPDLVSVALSPFLQSVPDELLIRFSWTSLSPASTNPNDWVAYGWMIDDVKIIESPAYDLAVTNTFYGTEGIPYFQIPLAQTSNTVFSATILNNGTATQTGVTFNVDVNNGAISGSTNPPISIEPFDTEQLGLQFIPQEIGNYNVDQFILSDFIGQDANPSNLVIDPINFDVTEFIYARDNGIQNGSLGQFAEPMEIGNRFKIYEDGELYALDALVTNVNPGDEVYVKLYFFSNDNFIEIPDATSSPIILNNQQIDQMTSFTFDEPVELIADSTYIAVIGSMNQNLRVGRAQAAPAQTVFLKQLQSNGWFFLNNAVMIRMNFDPNAEMAEPIQRDLAMELISPQEGEILNPSSFPISFNIVNNGPDPIQEGEIIYFAYQENGTVYNFNEGNQGFVDGISAPNDINAGEKLFWQDIENVFGQFIMDYENISDPTTICAWVLGVGQETLNNGGQDPNDPDLSNNTQCFDIQPFANIQITDATLSTEEACPRERVDLTFETSDEFLEGNSFIVEHSQDFNAWTIANQVEATENGVINFGVPVGSMAGELFVRLRSTNPARIYDIETPLIITQTLPTDKPFVNGSSDICSDQQANYSVNPLIGIDTYNWFVSGDLFITQNNGLDIQVNPTSNDGSGEIYVLAENSCGTINRSITEIQLIETEEHFNSGSALNFGGNYTSFSAEAVYIEDNDGSFEGCSGYPSNSLDGKIALIDRGGCFFSTKMYQAELAGAVGVIIINNNPAEGAINLVPGDFQQEISIPGLSLSFDDGQVIKDYINDNGTATIQLFQDVFKVNIVEQQEISIGDLENVSACGVADGTVEILGEGNGMISITSNNYFNQVEGDLPLILDNLPAGNFTVTFQNGPCVSNELMVSIVEPNAPDAPSVIVDGSTVLCEGETTELISSVENGITWSNGETTPSITVSEAGNYWVTVEENGCSSQSQSVSVQVNEKPEAPFIFSQTGENTICQGSSLELFSSYPNGNVWSTNETTQSITVEETGNYSVVFTDENSCSSDEASVFIEVLELPEISLTDSSNPTACGEADGVIALSGEGQGQLTVSGSFNFVQMVDFDNNFEADNVPSGTYNFVFNDGSCNSLPLTVNLSDPDGPETPTISADGPTTLCQGESVILTSSAETGNTWSNQETGNFIEVTASGSYSVTVQEDGCTAVSEPISVTVNPVPNVPMIQANGNTVICENETVTLEVINYSSSLEWSNNVTSNSITVGEAGVYSVTYESSNGCTATSNEIEVEVIETPTFSVSDIESPSECGSSDGQATFEGTGSGTLLLSGALNSSTSVNLPATLTNLPAGNYSAVFQSSGCSSTPVGFTISDLDGPDTPEIEASGSTNICIGQSVQLTSSSEAGNFWSNGLTSQTITVSSTGTFTVTVTENGCTSVSDPVEVVVNDLPVVPTINANPSNGQICDGDAIFLTANYNNNVVWSDGSTTQTILVNETESFTITFTDGNGCSSTSEVFDVVVNENPVIDNITTTDSDCTEDTGTATVDVSGGTPEYTFEWFGNDPNALGFGDYTVEVTDEKGCTATEEFSILNVDAPEVDVETNSQVCLEDEASGSVTVNVTGGTPDYSFSIDGGVTSQTENEFDELEVGNYEVQVIDDAGCQTIVSFVIDAAEEITTDQTIEICDGSSFTVGNDVFTEAGEYTTILEGASINGCDSTVNTTIVILDAPSNGISESNAVLTADQSGASYVWIDCDNDNAPIAGENDQSFTATENGNYAVIVTLGECEITSDCIEITGLSVKNSDMTKIKVYPNPNTGTFKVETEFDSELTLLDFTGKLVYQQKVTAGTNELSISNLAKGAYTLRLSNPNGLHIERLVIQ